MICKGLTCWERTESLTVATVTKGVLGMVIWMFIWSFLDYINCQSLFHLCFHPFSFLLLCFVIGLRLCFWCPCPYLPFHHRAICLFQRPVVALTMWVQRGGAGAGRAAARQCQSGDSKSCGRSIIGASPSCTTEVMCCLRVRRKSGGGERDRAKTVGLTH